jgi:hypothetical protein
MHIGRRSAVAQYGLDRKPYRHIFDIAEMTKTLRRTP